MILVLSFRAVLASVISTGLLAAPAFASHVHHTSTSGSAHHSRRLLGHHRSHRLHGQQTIDPERATEIQQALIRQHYLAGDPTGKWDPATVAAMQKYQADQGWQTKLMPDSRALKKLGLGPDYSNALNAQGSSFSSPPPSGTIPTDQVAGFTAASGVHQ
jgi:hypothetical protein